MKLLSKFFLGVLLLTVASVSWAACPEGTKQTYKGCESIVSEDLPKNEQKSKTGEGPTPDEPALEDCNDLICGNWETNNGSTFQMLATPGNFWDFESRILKITKKMAGWKVGGISFRFNKVSESQYDGECLWRNLLGVVDGWYACTVFLKDEKFFRLVNTELPSGNITTPTKWTAKRIGEPPKLRSKKTAGSGTGFFVSSDGLIITNHHVVEGANEVSVRVPTGETLNAKVVSQSPSTDLALLQVSHQTSNYLTFENPGAVEIGDDVFTMGFPISALLGKEVKYSEGVINSLSGIQGDATFFQISVPIQPGNSGGPLINEDGNVVGIVTSTAAVEAFYKATGSLPQNVNWAVKGAYASLLLPPGIQQDQRTIGNPITNAKHSVVFIETK